MVFAVFTAIVMWPDRSPPQSMGDVLKQSTLGTTLNDPATHKYLMALEQTYPKVARSLLKDAEQAIAGGASQNEVAQLAMMAHSTEIERDYERLIFADVGHWDGLIGQLRQGVSALSREAPKYCRPSFYAHLEAADPDDVIAEVSGFLDYGTPGYSWVMQFSATLLEAIEAGKSSPKKYGRLTAEDADALETLVTRVSRAPNISRLMRLQSQDSANAQRAMMTSNMCDVAAEVLSAVDNIPSETKSRMLGELQRNDFDMQMISTMIALQGGF